MKSGIYESLITHLLEERLNKLSDSYYIEKQQMDSAEAGEYLSRFLTRVLFIALESLPNTRDEILAAFGQHRFDRKSGSREGVIEIKSLNCELLFVTLQKTEKKFSPTTLYHDYAINDILFHWQTQNAARPDLGKGLSYIEHKETGKKIILFVREQTHDEFDRAMGFVNLGPVNLESHHGSQPMNITWCLETPIPAYLWHDAAKLSVG